MASNVTKPDAQIRIKQMMCLPYTDTLTQAPDEMSSLSVQETVEDGEDEDEDSDSVSQETIGKISNETVIAIAADKGSLEVLEALLNAEADPNFGAESSYNALLIVCDCAYSGSDVDSKIETLLNHGARIDTFSETWGTILYQAIRSDRVSDTMIKRLIGRGADINKLVPGEFSPLHGACISGRSDFARYLVEAGAEINTTDMLGRSALHIANSDRDSTPVAVELLLGLGVDPSQIDIRGCSSLHYAARLGRIAAVKCLLDRGADATKVDLNDWTPLH